MDKNNGVQTTHGGKGDQTGDRNARLNGKQGGRCQNTGHTTRGELETKWAEQERRETKTRENWKRKGKKPGDRRAAKRESKRTTETPRDRGLAKQE